METVTTISDVQWDAARLAFEASLGDKEGMSESRYDLIVDVLAGWDDMTPPERRVKASGNQAYWYKKYSLSTVGEKIELLMHDSEAGTGEVDEAVITGTMMRCSHQGRMFDDIKSVHIESELCQPRFAVVACTTAAAFVCWQRIMQRTPGFSRQSAPSSAHRYRRQPA